jgi:hypothetical protein
MRIFAPVLSAAAVFTLTLSALAAPGAKPEPKTAAAVIAADEGWTKAEETKDVAYVNNLLLPDYRSISADGSVHDKAAILAHMQTNTSADRTAAVEKWRAAHPYETSAVITGDIAVLTFHLKAQAPEKGIMSSDIFVYSDGQWHAIYSQHTDAGK